MKTGTRSYRPLAPYSLYYKKISIMIALPPTTLLYIECLDTDLHNTIFLTPIDL